MVTFLKFFSSPFCKAAASTCNSSTAKGFRSTSIFGSAATKRKPQPVFFPTLPPPSLRRTPFISPDAGIFLLNLLTRSSSAIKDHVCCSDAICRASANIRSITSAYKDEHANATQPFSKIKCSRAIKPVSCQFIRGAHQRTGKLDPVISKMFLIQHRWNF